MESGAVLGWTFYLKKEIYMKSTEIIQPVAMATPIAVTGSKDTIPQEQTSAQEPWFCSIEKILGYIVFAVGVSVWFW